MVRGSNAVLGVVNFITFIISIPILGAGIYLSTKANSGECLRFLQWPLIIISICIMVLSLAGLAGSCYGVTCLLRFYLLFMFVAIITIIGFIIFAFTVTDKGGGHAVLNRGYDEYRLQDYSGWLKDRIKDPGYWTKVSDCLRDAKVCKHTKMYLQNQITGEIIPEPADSFYQRKLSPIESGCCKPPTSCGFVYMNETFWNPIGDGDAAIVNIDSDCTEWSNDQRRLCFNCDSCKAGVLSKVKKSWRSASVVTIVVLVIMVIVYVVAFAAFRNNRRTRNNEPSQMGGMTKSRPSRFNF